MSTNPLSPLQELLNELRHPQEGCAWTQSQTFSSLIPQTIEETYELQEALLEENPQHIQEELGDLLYHVLFYIELAQEKGWFTLEDVASVMLKKHQQRMPDKETRKSFSAEEANAHWQAQKRKKYTGEDPLCRVPTTLPALMATYQIQDKMAQLGFDWKQAEEVLPKIAEEFAEIREAMAAGQVEQAQQEAGDLLFTTVNLIRHLGAHPENILKSTNVRFKQRVLHMVQAMKQQALSWETVSTEQLEALWENSKLAC